MEAYCTERLPQKYHRIVIIGMPCSGKSSIGRLIAAHYGLEFYDLDAEIERTAGMTIEEIFRNLGEGEFRRIETEVTQRMSKVSGAVLATGGGIVTKPQNMALLKQPDSFVVYIHRDFYKIATTPKRIMEKRPILQHTSYDKLLTLYKQRLPLYRKYADFEVKNDKQRDESVRIILQDLDRVLSDATENGVDE